MVTSPDSGSELENSDPLTDQILKQKDPDCGRPSLEAIISLGSSYYICEIKAATRRETISYSISRNCLELGSNSKEGSSVLRIKFLYSIRNTRNQIILARPPLYRESCA
jgi:hypothetical protein